MLAQKTTKYSSVKTTEISSIFVPPPPFVSESYVLYQTRYNIDRLSKKDGLVITTAKFNDEQGLRAAIRETVYKLRGCGVVDVMSAEYNGKLRVLQRWHGIENATEILAMSFDAVGFLAVCKNNKGMEEHFDTGIEYYIVGLTPNDGCKAISKNGEEVICFLSRFSFYPITL